MSTVWILWVLVAQDGVWRAWEREYPTLDSCLEVKQIITMHRENQIRAECRLQQ